MVTQIQMVAVQARWTLADYRDDAAFAGFVDRLMAAVDLVREAQHPCLVAFPEFIGLPLLFLDAADDLGGCSSWQEAGMRLVGKHGAEVQPLMQRYGVGPLRALMLLQAPRIASVYCSTFARAAAAHNCYLVAGSAPLPSTAAADGKVYNVSYFFGPDGSVIGRQGKVHPYGREATADGLDLTGAALESLQSFETPFGKVGIAICYDAFQQDVLSMLAGQGASIVIQPSANARVWDEWQAGDWERGLWSAVQHYPQIQCGINPMMVGSLFAPDDEYSCQGRSAIVTKIDRTSDSSGYVQRAREQPWSSYCEEELVTAVLSLR